MTIWVNVQMNSRFHEQIWMGRKYQINTEGRLNWKTQLLKHELDY